MGRRRYTVVDWRAVRGELGSGATIREAAARTGVPRSTVHDWGRRDDPHEGMWLAMSTEPGAARPRVKGARLTYEDRVMIFSMRGGGSSHAEIARAVGCDRSTVSRELRRAPEGAYDPRLAQRDAEEAARRPKARRLDSSPRLRAEVVRMLSLGWSPEQVSARLAGECPDDPEMRLSHEAIYQALYVQGRGSLRQELRVEQALRSGRAARRPRSGLPERRGRRTWVEGCEISLRPAEAADRAVPGHWEGDLVVGPGGACLVTLVERSTRYLEARRLDARDSRTVVDLLVSMVEAVPEGIRSALLSTLTWDQGAELAQAARFTEATGFRVYFCDPRSPWQRGTNENTNGLLRQYFPKGTDFSRVTDEQVREAQDLLNGRPRKTLGWRTPAEALAEALAEANGAMIA